MSVYIDASVLVSAILNESNSELVRSWWKRLAAPAIVSELACLEAAAVISRAVRSGRFTNGDAAIALQSLDGLRAGSRPRVHGPADFALAEVLARNFTTKLAAPDALHLATAIYAGASLATFDLRLAAAAQSSGADLAEIV